MDKTHKRRGGDAVLKDPYLREVNYKEPNICPSCKAVYHNKRWQFDDKLEHKIKLESNYGRKKCPACRKIHDNYPMGLVFISGDFIGQHNKEILSTVKSEEKRAIGKNPLERIMVIEKTDANQYVIKTTTDTLAQRIGKILNNSYKGKIEYKFSEGQKILQVFWSRGE
ncbi:ATPase [candidate division WOR-3 bacterium]|nr:ATPase [candidate division WOR-3 bacterium]